MKSLQTPNASWAAKVTFTGCLLVLLLMGCSVSDVSKPVANDPSPVDLTEIHQGMQAEQVKANLGSPNKIERASDGGEIWIYDGVPAYAAYPFEEQEKDLGNIKALLLEKNSGAGEMKALDADYTPKRKLSRTLTLIIRVGPGEKVDSFSYYANRF